MNQTLKLITMTDKLGQLKTAIKALEADMAEPKNYLTDYFNNNPKEVIMGHSFKSQFIIVNRSDWNKEAIEQLAAQARIPLEALKKAYQTAYPQTYPLPSAFK